MKFIHELSTLIIRKTSWSELESNLRALILKTATIITTVITTINTTTRITNIITNITTIITNIISTIIKSM
jgi:hypothetical protein